MGRPKNSTDPSANIPLNLSNQQQLGKLPLNAARADDPE